VTWALSNEFQIHGHRSLRRRQMRFLMAAPSRMAGFVSRTYVQQRRATCSVDLPILDYGPATVFNGVCV
jgi:hypothetical protein